jgi:DNA polymerase III subunit delta
VIAKSYEISKKISNFLKYNLFLLYGENVGLKKDITKIIKQAIENKETEYLSFYENEIYENEDNFYNSIYSGSLFGDKKVISINSGSDKILKQIEDISEKCPENIFLIVNADVLEKKSKLRNFFEKNTKTLCVPCYLDNDRDLEIIATNELKKNNISISREIINLIVEKSNKDRNNLKNEIEKIKSFALNKKNLEANDIKRLINFSGEHKIDILINECLSGNITEYKKILSETYTNSVNQIFLLRALNNKMQRLLAMKKAQVDFSNLDSLLNATKPPIFWLEKATVKKQLTIWSLSNIQKTINEINETELLCKKKPQLSKVIFFKFFTGVCKKVSSSF